MKKKLCIKCKYSYLDNESGAMYCTKRVEKETEYVYGSFHYFVSDLSRCEDVNPDGKCSWFKRNITGFIIDCLCWGG